MTDILSAMVTYLEGTAGVTTLTSTRIYPLALLPATTASPSTMPAVTFQLIDEPTVTTHENNVLFHARVQLDAYGISYKSAHAVADALFTALHGYKGTWSPYIVGSVMRKRKNDLSEPEESLFRVSQDFVISYR